MLAESGFIVLSVLLALAVDEWRESRGRAERAEVALQGIEAELRGNLQGMVAARANHIAMHDSLERYVSLGELPPPHVYLRGIFNPAPVLSTAWDSARETGATSEFEYELLLQLSRTYGQQARYRAMGDVLAQDLMADVRRFGMEAVLRNNPRGFMALEEDFSNREGALIEAYRSSLRVMGSESH